MKMTLKKKKIIGPIIIVSLLVGCGSYNFYDGLKPSPEILYGTVEAKAYDIQSRAAGLLTSVLIQEGQTMKVGELAAVIDGQDVDVKLSQSELSLKTAENELGKLNDGSRQEEISMQAAVVKQSAAQIAAYKESLNKLKALQQQAANNVSQSKTVLKDREKLLTDTKALYAANATSETTLEAAKLSFDQASYALQNAESQKKAADADILSGNNQLKSLEAQKKVAEEKLRLIKKPVIERQKTTGELAVVQAQKGVELNRVLLDKYKAYSQAEGIIQAVYFDKGEYVSVGSPIATLIDPKDTWATFFAPETMLTKLKVGQTVYLESTSSEVRTKGVIMVVAQKAEFTPVNIVTTSDRKKLVFKVKVSIEEVEGIQPGMMVALTLKEGQHGTSK